MFKGTNKQLLDHNRWNATFLQVLLSRWSSFYSLKTFSWWDVLLRFRNFITHKCYNTIQQLFCQALRVIKSKSKVFDTTRTSQDNSLYLHGMRKWAHSYNMIQSDFEYQAFHMCSYITYVAHEVIAFQVKQWANWLSLGGWGSSCWRRLLMFDENVSFVV